MRTALATSEATQGPPELFGPPGPEIAATYGPELPKIKSVVLVLGPGRARSYSAVGVLRVLQDEKIPVSAVIGTETGGVVAALFATTKNINQMEWALQKIKKEHLFKKTGLFSDVLGGRENKLRNAYKKIFSAQNQIKIPAYIGQQAKEGPTLLLIQGAPEEAVTAGILNSCAENKPYFVNEAVEIQRGPVIVIDTLPEPAEIKFPEVKRADYILRPELEGVEETDLEKRTQIIFSGQRIAKDHIKEIKRLVGIEEVGKEP